MIPPRLPGCLGAIITDRRPIDCTACMSSRFSCCRLKIPGAITCDATTYVIIVPLRRRKLTSGLVRLSAAQLVVVRRSRPSIQFCAEWERGSTRREPPARPPLLVVLAATDRTDAVVLVRGKGGRTLPLRVCTAGVVG